MKTKKWILPICIIIGIIVLCIVGLLATAGIMSTKGYGISVGRLYLSDNRFYLVDEGKAMIMSDQSDDNNLFDKFNTGDLIFVIHDGVNESYPSRTGAHRVFRLSKGNENDLPENLDIGVVKNEDGTADILNTPTEYYTQCIRTNGYREDMKYPVVKIIRSVGELNEYYEANKEKYDLERKDNVSINTTIGFLDACDKYDDAYFKDNILVMVLLEEGSGSIRHKVQSVNMGNDGRCYINIERIVPEAGTADMAQWHILIEPKIGVEIEKESDIIVFVDGIDPIAQSDLIWHSHRNANIFLRVFDGWEYEIEEREGSNEFCIAFWPTGRSEGKIKVWYYEFFGVCGTGLEEKKITIGNYEACKGTYDNKEVWDFIILLGTPDYYVIMNNGADMWWSEYGDEAMQILNTLVVGDGSVSESDEIDITK